LQDAGGDETERHQADKGRDPQNGDVVAGQIEERLVQPDNMHDLIFPRKEPLQNWKQKTRPKPCFKSHY
jgi:hypothetical protein